LKKNQHIRSYPKLFCKSYVLDFQNLGKHFRGVKAMKNAEAHISSNSRQQSLKGNKANAKACAVILNNPNLLGILDNVATRAAGIYHQDADELWQIMVDGIYKYPDKISEALNKESWFYEIAKNYCLNEIRHQKVVSSGAKKIKRQQQSGTKINSRPLIQSTLVTTPEQELLEKEHEILKKEQGIRLQEAVQKVSKRFPKWLVDGWTDGNSAKEISETSNKSLATVYRRLKDMQKAIIKEFGEQPLW
jgi:RNA polymerase sigma factor (sigma-70 family)